MFRAWLVTKTDSEYEARLSQLDQSSLPEGDVTVRVLNSAINYKDALALTNKAPVIRRFPMVPGIDLAGVVEQSNMPEFRSGDQVILTGFGLGEIHWGGLSELARVNSKWLLSLPPRFTFSQAMAIGTAGLTAMLAIMGLERFGVKPECGEILVTGASGAVGSFAIHLLSRLGYAVVASTGRINESNYLRSLGAGEIIDRAQFSAPGKPLGKERWAGAIDSVGSHTLANVCASLKRGAAVAACGMAQGIDFPASVAPFILRGVALLGIDSAGASRHERSIAWERLDRTIDRHTLAEIAQIRPLVDAKKVAEEILAGKIRGRVVIDVAGTMDSGVLP